MSILVFPILASLVAQAESVLAKPVEYALDYYIELECYSFAFAFVFSDN
jgi:hypothetical protein